jgi:hypothetical protein
MRPWQAVRVDGTAPNPKPHSFHGVRKAGLNSLCAGEVAPGAGESGVEQGVGAKPHLNGEERRGSISCGALEVTACWRISAFESLQRLTR